MNLEELKDIWQAQSNAHSTTYAVEEQDIYRILHNKSESALGKINRNIRFEVGLALLFGLIGFGAAFRSEGVYWIELVFWVVYLMGSGIFYYVKYKALNQQSMNTDNLRGTLIELVSTMRQYMNIYFYFTAIGAPLLGISALFYGIYRASMDKGEPLSSFPMEGWIMFGVVGVIYGLFSVWFTRMYVKKLYGIHYEKLRDCLRELEEWE
ncbi:MAG: hypothetical protein AAGI38_03595 [Bacteroidota bacterium]